MKQPQKDIILECPNCQSIYFQRVELARSKKDDIKFDSPTSPLPEDRKYIYVCGQCGFVITGEPKIIPKEIEVIVTKDSVGMKVRKLKEIVGQFIVSPTIICHTTKDYENLKLSMGQDMIIGKNMIINSKNKNSLFLIDIVIEYGFNEEFMQHILLQFPPKHIILLTKNEWEKHQDKILEGYKEYRVIMKEEKL